MNFFVVYVFFRNFGSATFLEDKTFHKSLPDSSDPPTQKRLKVLFFYGDNMHRIGLNYRRPRLFGLDVGLEMEMAFLGPNLIQANLKSQKDSR